MDANGQRFWLALGGTPWIPTQPGILEVLPGHLRLASVTAGDPFREDRTGAEAALARVPMARDAFGTWAWVDDDGVTIRATGAYSEPEPPAASPRLLTAPAAVTDLALGHDGVLYVLAGGAVQLHPLDPRLPAEVLALSGFMAWRFAAAPEGGGWTLDRTQRALARISGRLWPTPLAFREPPPTAFVPEEENPDPPQLHRVPDGWLEPGEEPVALACSPVGRLGVLVWTDGPARVVIVDADGRRAEVATLPQLERPFSLAWMSPERLAVLAPGLTEAVVYTWRAGELTASGEVYPLRDHEGGPFFHRVTLPVEYPAHAASGSDRRLPRPLVALSLPSLAPQGEARLASAFDSGQADTAWHRLYVEADLPAGTSFTVLAAATEGDLPEWEPEETAWQPHHFGPVTAGAHEPRAAWVPSVSEIPGHAGLAGPPEAGRRGLFTVLLQRAHCPVRTLRGRFLHLRIVLRGSLRATPCLHAVRAYGPRFSYQDRYLPALYRETEFGPDADRPAPGEPSTRPDFLGRLLANFEGLLTPLEDRVAHSWLLTEPRQTPEEAIDWLAAWIGADTAPWYPARQRRRHLRAAPELFRARGTRRGLELALDVATDDGVRRGRIVVVEDHWFRRTLQTVLGLDLDREDDPLLGGPSRSGNSRVGNTLFLSEEGAEKKFLALFDASLALKAADRETVETFFASLAHRVTVIVHETTTAEECALIERLCAREVPAHVATRVHRADTDFMVGLTALLSVDTYLRPAPPARSVAIQASRVGDGSLLQRPRSLDPRLEGSSS